MIRRKRRSREIPFSFDSFLDVVANVVGIIIRLILVAWVGARSYKGLITTAPAPDSPASSVVQSQEVHDPLEQELLRHRQELAQVQARLLEQLRQLQVVQGAHDDVQARVTALEKHRHTVATERAALDQVTAVRNQSMQKTALSLEELHRRRQQLLADIGALEKLPPPKVLRYHTPVSRPVQAEEFLFECRGGRVTFVDIGSLLEEVRRGMDAKTQALRTRWQVEDVTPAVGAFRLHYVIERERGALDAALPGSAPAGEGPFQCSLSQWSLEPIAAVRGEGLADALETGSEFHAVADHIDPHQGVITFWVYPDSFGLYRQLRDYLYDRNIVVAGRPLPEGIQITASRQGSVSRGE